MAILRKCLNRSTRSGIASRDYKHIRLALTGKVAIILLFILSGSSAAQPRATIRPDSRAVPLNRQLRVTLELTWTGDADAYDVPQPDVSALAGFEIAERGLSAERKNETSVLRYEFILQPLKHGEYDLGRIRVKYFEKGGDTPTIIPLPRTPIEVLPRELLPPRARIAVVIGAVAVLGVAITIIVRGRRGKSGAVSASDTRRDELSTQLKGARSLRIEGEFGEYMQALSRLARSKQLAPHVAGLDDLLGLTEKVRFGGLIPSPEQLDWAEKTVKKAIRAAFPVEDESEQD